MEAGKEMVGPVLAEATEKPRQGLSAKLWDRPTWRWATERSFLQGLPEGFPSPGASAGHRGGGVALGHLNLTLLHL